MPICTKLFKLKFFPWTGFQSGSLGWDDEDDDNRDSISGDLPDGSYSRNTVIEYCCRSDGAATTPIALPNRKPFYLFRYTSSCQAVKDLRVTEEVFTWDDEDDNNRDSKSGDHPYDDGGSRNHRLHYCYYY